MRNIVILVGSMRKGGNTDLLARKFAEGAAELPNLFDPILMQYQMVPTTINPHEAILSSTAIQFLARVPLALTETIIG